MITVAELDERIERCLAILADNPHSQVFAALAEAYRRRGEFGRAFAVCKSGLKHHPDYAPAHVVMAKLYLHQKMLPDAMSSLRKAIDIDGSTRATDLLEAELHIEMGDVSAAQPIVERLQRAERRNPAVIDLVMRLKELRNQPVPTAEPTDDAETVDNQAEPTDTETTPSANETISWEQWADHIRGLRGVTSVFAWDQSANVIYPVDATTTGDHAVNALLEAFREIDSHLNGAGSGSLGELRVETEQGEFWCGHLDAMILGLIGDPRISYGEARRAAIDWYARIDRSGTASHPDPDESSEQ
ncbi:MAG: tetratricopeptide repeat protein [candidate division Zixibacteria bacterium]|nr:tetratricopeptide repeat protein [candidate division Zixibacteria bacterium]